MPKSIFNSMILIGLCVVCLAVPAQRASAGMGEADAGSIRVKSGVATPIRKFISECTTPVYYGVSGMGAHGKISTRQATGRHCGQDNFLETLVIYTPDPGFVGADDIMLYAFNWHIGMSIRVVK